MSIGNSAVDNFPNTLYIEKTTNRTGYKSAYHTHNDNLIWRIVWLTKTRSYLTHILILPVVIQGQ